MFSLTVMACRQEKNGVLKAFVPTSIGGSAVETMNFTLSRIPNVPHRVTRAMPEFSSEERDDEFFDPQDPEKSIWAVSFGKLGEGDFKRLKSLYFDNPKLSYQAGRRYDLLDFMPPQIQALSGFRFNAEQIDSDIAFGAGAKEKGFYGFETLSNCWNAAYEIVRGDTASTSIFYVEGSEALVPLTDEAYSESIKKYSLTPDWESVPQSVRNEGLNPFDVILVFAKYKGSKTESLQHVAIFIDDEFYFEKTGPDSTLNYRFVKFDEIAVIYSEWKDARVEVRRFNGQRLPPAREVFSLKAQKGTLPEGFAEAALDQALPNLLNMVTGYAPVNWAEGSYRDLFYFAEVPLIYDTRTDRYALSPEAFKSVIRSVGCPAQ